MEPVRFVAGLDVAQQHDASCLCILELVGGPEPLRMVHLDAWMLPYPETKMRVAAALDRDPLKGRILLFVDSTGPGLALHEELRLVPSVRESVGDDRLFGMMITGGQAVRRNGGFIHCGKFPLIAGLRSAIGGGKLQIPKTLPLAGALLREAEAFTAHQRPTGTWQLGNDPKLAPRDDMVLATALGVLGARIHLAAASSTHTNRREIRCPR